MADLNPDQQQPESILSIVNEAKSRWLVPSEICRMISKYEQLGLRTEHLNVPEAGSVFLFDRKEMKHFRNDGYTWSKMKDGKTVKESHEKLKIKGLEVLQCYYGHGEGDESFQRRSYWMLEGNLQDIVLVHYREIKEGNKSRISQSSSAPSSTQENSLAVPHQMPLTTNIAADQNRQPSSSQYEDANLGDNPGAQHSMQPPSGSPTPIPFRFPPGHEWFSEDYGNPFGSLQPIPQTVNYNPSGSSSVWTGAQSSTTNDNLMHGQESSFAQPAGANFITPYIHDLDNERLISSKDTQVAEMTLESDSQGADIDVLPLVELDSTESWMDSTTMANCDSSFMACSSGKNLSGLGAENDAKEGSRTLPHHIPQDTISFRPSVSPELFRISDFVPEWAYADVETKVLIVGVYLGDNQYPAELKWGCLFGEIEVPAEIIPGNALRCQTPLHAPGSVPLYVTCDGLLAHKESMNFEFREYPQPEDKVRKQIRLGMMLLCLQPGRKPFNIFTNDCEKWKVGKTIQSKKIDAGRGGAEVLSNDWLMEYLLLDRLCEWLVCKIHEGGKGPTLLDDEREGAIHLAACLGYLCAISMKLIVAAGVSSNFRDAHGRTGQLNWASYFGREETALELVEDSTSAFPGAVADPTSSLRSAVDDKSLVFSGGRMAADHAPCRGHNGITEYWSEEDFN